MKAEQSARGKRPITVNDRLLDRISALTDELQEEALQRHAEKNGVPIDKLKQCIADPGSIDTNVVVNYATDPKIFKRERAENIVRASKDFKSYHSLVLTVRFDNDFSVTLNSFDQLKATLENEPSNPYSIHMICGNAFGSPLITLSLRNLMETYSFQLTGSKREIDYYNRAMLEAIRASMPDYYYFHLAKCQALIALVLSIYCNYYFTQLASKLKLGVVNATLASGWVVNISSIIFQAAIFLGAITLLERAFPKCSFEYGDGWRRQRARVVVLGVFLTALALPIVVSWIT
jgi:hypothetical protein